MTTVVPTCRSCRWWRPDVLAFPDHPRPGSLRICGRGKQTDACSWKPCHEPRTAEEEGRLFR